MSRFAVIVTPVVTRELREIRDYIQRDGNADLIEDRLLDAIHSLEHLPMRAVEVAKSRRGTPVHRLIVLPFLIYYRVEASKQEVVVLRVVHGARRQPASFS